MSDSNTMDSTSTAKCSPERQAPGFGRYVLNVRVLVTRLDELCQQFVWLSEPMSAEWLTLEEVSSLLHLWRDVAQLKDRATQWEQRWRVRQGLSPKS